MRLTVTFRSLRYGPLDAGQGRRMGPRSDGKKVEKKLKKAVGFPPYATHAAPSPTSPPKKTPPFLTVRVEYFRRDWLYFAIPNAKRRRNRACEAPEGLLRRPISDPTFAARTEPLLRCLVVFDHFPYFVVNTDEPIDACTRFLLTVDANTVFSRARN